VISGNTVSNCLGNDYGIWTFVNYLPIAVENNSVSGCALPYSAWGSANTTIATFTNNTATAPSPNTGSVGIYVTTSEAGWGYADVYANFTGNALSGFETGIALSADETTWDPDPYVAKTIHSTIYRNNITGSTEMAVFQGTSGAYDIHLEENWWGSFMGPQRPISSNVDVIQWCGTANPTCLPLLPVDGTITLSGTIDEPGGLNVYVPGLTILLADGTVVQNTGAGCFSVYASQTTIQAASKLGAQCIPGTGYNGVDVAAGLQNVNVGNIEFLGPGMDGVHFAGVTDYLWVWDNWFHTLSGDALEFVSQPTGTISIQGNLFQENDGLGISTGAFVVPAEFNSWGHIGGASLGDGASPTVDADPWTHVDMYLTSSDPVSIGGNVTYTVYGNYENVMGAAFTLAYPTDKLQLVGTPTNLSGFVAAGPTLFDTTTLGAVKFNGIVPGSTPITGANLPIYRATFKVLADGALLDLLDTDDLFSMAPNDAGPSTNIYALKLVDAWVTIHHYTVTGTVYMQGRSVRSGVPATLNDLVYYGLYNAVSTQTPIPGNLVFSNVAAGTYLFTTNQARYLNIPDSMAKTFVLSANRTLPNLTLKGGNAIWTDNIIDVNDAAKVGTDYGIGDITDDSDVNFSGAVDIFDLTMVGLNFDLTSETAYGTWVP
jgi:hypothetical protein